MPPGRTASCLIGGNSWAFCSVCWVYHKLYLSEAFGWWICCRNGCLWRFYRVLQHTLAIPLADAALFLYWQVSLQMGTIPGTLWDTDQWIELFTRCIILICSYQNVLKMWNSQIGERFGLSVLHGYNGEIFPLHSLSSKSPNFWNFFGRVKFWGGLSYWYIMGGFFCS